MAPDLRPMWVRQHDVSHDVGVSLGREAAVADGLEDVRWINPFEYHGRYGQGLDDLRVAGDGRLFVVEYKGGSANLNPGGDLVTTFHPPQMSRDWVVRNIARLEGGDANGQYWGEILRAALEKRAVNLANLPPGMHFPPPNTPFIDTTKGLEGIAYGTRRQGPLETTEIILRTSY